MGRCAVPLPFAGCDRPPRVSPSIRLHQSSSPPAGPILSRRLGQRNPLTLSSRPRRRPPPVRPQSSATAPAWQPEARQVGDGRPQLAPLPKLPESADLRHLLPYMVRLALVDRTLHWRLGMAILCLVAAKASGLASPIFLKKAVEAMGLTGSAAIQGALGAVLISGLCRIVSAIARELQNPIFTPVAQAAGRTVASNTFAHVLNLNVQFHLDQQTGMLTRILERGTRSVYMLFRIVVFNFLPTLVELIFVTTLLANSISPLVALVTVGTFSAYILWTLSMTQSVTEVRKVANEYENRTTGKAVDALQNFETVTLFNNQQMEVAQYDEFLRGSQEASIAMEQKIALLNGGQGTILAMGLTMALVTSLLAGAGKLTAGDLVLVQGLLLQLWLPLQFLGWFYREVRQSIVDMEEFLRILQTETTLPDGPLEFPPIRHLNGKSINGNGVSIPLQAENSTRSSNYGLAVDFNDVKFGYTPERQVLKGVNLKILPGQNVAIVGGSGSGKSTLLKLLVRLYDVDKGAIHCDGIDIRDLKLESLRDSIGVVPQDTVLFNDTIMQNIRYGRPTASNDEVYQAAKMAQLDGAITRMPDGYQTMVGPRGLKLSGGEKQRVAIARTFLRAPRLLICDEATSSLDTATEKEIISSLNKLAEGRTTVSVAHRLSTIQDSDIIFVMSNGRIVEQGTHDELIGLGLTYYNMWTAQVAGRDRYEKCIPVF